MGGATRSGEDGVAVSSFSVAMSIDWRDNRPDVVRGSLLLVAVFEPFVRLVMLCRALSSFAPVRNGIGPVMTVRCRVSRSAK